jgi:hypothetical protein
VTVAVNGYVAAVAGMPLMLPLAWNDNPDVEMAPTGDQVYGGVPPVAVSMI